MWSWANDNDSVRTDFETVHYGIMKVQNSKFVGLSSSCWSQRRGCNDLYILWFLGDLMRDLWQLWFHEIIMIAAFFRRLPRIIAVLAWHSSQLPHWICMSSYIRLLFKKNRNFWSMLFVIDNSIWKVKFFVSQTLIQVKAKWKPLQYWHKSCTKYF